MILRRMLLILLLGTVLLTFKTEPVMAGAGVFAVKHKGFVDPLMEWYTVVGIVMNNGSSYATDIKVRCVFRDAEGKLVTIEEKTIYRGWLSFDKQYLPPGWTAPFKVTVADTDLSKQIASYEISVTYVQAAELLKTNSLTIQEISLRLAERNELFGYEKWRVTGIVKNLATYNATNTKVKAIFLDGDGFPIGFGGDSLYDTQPDTILPNDIGFFSLETIVPIYSDIKDVQLMIESDEAFGHYPSLPFKSQFAIKWETRTFSVHIFSNSSVGVPDLNQSAKQLSFLIAGENSTTGFCNITIPKELLWCERPTDWIITVDGEPVTYQATETETHTSLYFTYEHSIKTVKIQGTHVIPEFPTWTSILHTFIMLAIAIVIYKRKLFKTINR